MAMDYSLVQRNPDGTGQFLVTTPGSPDVGSYETEAQLKTWIQQDITDGTITAKKAECDQYGNVIDTTYAKETDLTDVKNALSATNARVENLEQEHGSYQEVTVKSPYTIPSGKAKNWSVNVLRGVTRARNNVVKNGQFNGTTDWTVVSGKVTLTASGNVGTITASVAQAYMQVQARTSINVIAGHQYLVCARMRMSSTVRVKGACDGFTTTPIDITPTANTWYTQTAIVTGASTGSYNLAFGWESTPSVGDKIEVTDIICTDLTLYFGGTIPSDADTIADIQTNYPELLVPSDYGSSLVDTEYDGVKSVFFNLWDGTFSETGKYIKSDGTLANDGSWKVTDYIEIKPNTAYYFLNLIPDPSTSAKIAFYDSDKNFISVNNITNGFSATSPSNAKYVRCSRDNSAINTCINISDASINGTYKPYQEPVTLSLPTPVILRSAGNVAEEFDLESGVKTNPITEYTITGNETFDYGNWDAGSISFYVSGIDVCKNYGGTLCAFHDNVQVIYASSRVYFRFKNGTSRWASVDAFKADAVGKKVYYELATPNAPTQLDPIQNPYLPTESGGTISSILTDAVDDSMTLGYINL